jgi:hypothetical protein
MAKERSNVEMTPQEVRAYLGSHRIMTLATIGREGVPHLVAMSYGIVEDKVVWWAYEKSQKVVNILRDPRLSVMVESGERGSEVAGVCITGRAEIIRDRDYVIGVAGPAIFAQMRDQEVDETAEEFLAKAGRKRIAVVVHPERVRSWDHSKLNDYWLGKDPAAGIQTKLAREAAERKAAPVR